LLKFQGILGSLLADTTLHLSQDQSHELGPGNPMDNVLSPPKTEGGEKIDVLPVSASPSHL
jgi:hypothetical protein